VHGKTEPHFNQNYIAAAKDINQASARFKKSTVGTFNEQFKAYAS
jgi:hypothetical protein